MAKFVELTGDGCVADGLHVGGCDVQIQVHDIVEDLNILIAETARASEKVDRNTKLTKAQKNIPLSVTKRSFVLLSVSELSTVGYFDDVRYRSDVFICLSDIPDPGLRNCLRFKSFRP